ncbi:DUF4190 domain-containing protein [Dactylosporangium sp. AC04546]|uniref:DUF4190 domain-containing protein n=1 Tax=Dactylosporangium sp. AC04546 TaxID=2862460 RepID=UPI001EE0C600|nr:DUF4190 domain-containing protein [Dactylosporangium sp. AC04546]WVK87739.1 DUF4190 domain-containing protein [Dactylosporangium sp. AC04546]
MINQNGRLESLPKAPLVADRAPRLTGTNKMAVASIICASLLCSLLGTPLAIIFGHVALHQIKHQEQHGRGLAIAGLVVGYAGVAFWVIMIIAMRKRFLAQ